MPPTLAAETCWAADILGSWPCDAERALGEALARSDAAEDAESDPRREAGGSADSEAVEPLDDATLVRALRGCPDPFDLPLLASIDPDALADPRDRLS